MTLNDNPAVNWEAEYKALVNELTRHMVPVGRYVKLVGYYGVQEGDERIAAVKLSESPCIYDALVLVGAQEGEAGGFRTLQCPFGQFYLHGQPQWERPRK